MSIAVQAALAVVNHHCRYGRFVPLRCCAICSLDVWSNFWMCTLRCCCWLSGEATSWSHVNHDTMTLEDLLTYLPYVKQFRGNIWTKFLGKIALYQLSPKVVERTTCRSSWSLEWHKHIIWLSMCKPGKAYSSGDLAEVVSWNPQALWMYRSQWSDPARQSLLVLWALSRESGFARRSILDAHQHPCEPQSLKLLSRERHTNNVNWMSKNVSCRLHFVSASTGYFGRRRQTWQANTTMWGPDDTTFSFLLSLKFAHNW